MLTVVIPHKGTEEMLKKCVDALNQFTGEPFILKVSTTHKSVSEGWNLGFYSAQYEKDDLFLIGDDDVVRENYLIAFREKVKEGNGLVGVRAKSIVFGFPIVGFHCVYITQETMQKVGKFDEGFLDCFFEDNDYCARCDNAGVKIDFVKEPKIDIGPSVVSSRLPHDCFPLNEARFREKWGVQ